MREALTTLRALLIRVGLSAFEVPFRDYQTFKTYWLRNDGYNRGRRGGTYSMGSSTYARRPRGS